MNASDNPVMLRCNSNRAWGKLLLLERHVLPYYYAEKLFNDKAKGYYLMSAEIAAEALKIKGITKPKDQDLKNYYQCW